MECDNVSNNGLDFNNFPYAYRFNDKNYNVLPKDDMSKIIPLSKEESSLFWEKYIDKASSHYKKIKIKDGRQEKILDDCGWGNKNDEEKTKDILKALTNDDTSIIIFWSKHYAARTTWEIFYKYWTDFCYPSDDGNVILYRNQTLIYDEDKLYGLKDYILTENE